MIGIRLAHTLTPEGRGVLLLRVLELEPRGPVRVVMPLLVAPFRTENARMMRALKAFAENEARAPDAAYARLSGRNTRRQIRNGFVFGRNGFAFEPPSPAPCPR